MKNTVEGEYRRFKAKFSLIYPKIYIVLGKNTKTYNMQTSIVLMADDIPLIQWRPFSPHLNTTEEMGAKKVLTMYRDGS